MNEIEKSNAVFDASEKLELMQSLAGVTLGLAEEGAANLDSIADMLHILIDGISTAREYLESILEAETKEVAA